MAGRPGIFGGIRLGDASERDAADGFASDGPFTPPVIRLGDPNALGQDGGFGGRGFDPVWGTLGAPTAQQDDPWLTSSRDEEAEGVAVDAEIFGDGFQISGQLHTGGFDRLSDWLNMQSGFIQVYEATHVHLGHTDTSDAEQKRGTMWVRLEQIVMVAERPGVPQSRPGAPVVQKQRRKVSIVTPGYSLRGCIHVHAHGSMQQFLETPDPHFLPITELTVRWLSDPELVSRFPFAMINRKQLITLLAEPLAPADGSTVEVATPADEALPYLSRSGAA
jgi:hypothetical protein